MMEDSLGGKEEWVEEENDWERRIDGGSDCFSWSADLVVDL